jgi:hypothetical protein
MTPEHLTELEAYIKTQWPTAFVSVEPIIAALKGALDDLSIKQELLDETFDDGDRLARENARLREHIQILVGVAERARKALEGK